MKRTRVSSNCPPFAFQFCSFRYYLVAIPNSLFVLRNFVWFFIRSVCCVMRWARISGCTGKSLYLFEFFETNYSDQKSMLDRPPQIRSTTECALVLLRLRPSTTDIPASQCNLSTHRQLIRRRPRLRVLDA